MSWESGIDIHQVSTVLCGSKVFIGAGAIKKMDFIAEEMVARGIKSVIVMTGKGAYQRTGAWDVVQKALESHSIDYILYNKVQPNPETHQVDEAVSVAREGNAQAVIAIGGGSAIDAAKSAAVLLEHPAKNCTELYEMKFAPKTAAPLVAVNLTHGTGSEANRFAVVTIPEKDYKPAIAYDCLYPWYSINDPELMLGLPENQTRYVSIDAVNHVIEAATTQLNNPYAITLGKEVIRMVAEYLPKALANPKDTQARYYLCYAAMLAGISFDNGSLHFTHALEHPLSGVKPELTHGFGLSLILPAVIQTIYASKGDILADILSPIVPGLSAKDTDASKAAEGVRAWLHSVGVKERLADVGFVEGDIPRLVELVFETPGLSGMIAIAPVEGTREIIQKIYQDSL